MGDDLSSHRADGDARAYVRERGEGFSAIVCSGGDGTLEEAVSGLMDGARYDGKPLLPLGYIPAGSTNDFGASLGISKEMTEAARMIVKGIPSGAISGALMRMTTLCTWRLSAFLQRYPMTPPGHEEYAGACGLRPARHSEPEQFKDLPCEGGDGECADRG